MRGSRRPARHRRASSAHVVAPGAGDGLAKLSLIWHARRLACVHFLLGRSACASEFCSWGARRSWGTSRRGRTLWATRPWAASPEATARCQWPQMLPPMRKVSRAGPTGGALATRAARRSSVRVKAWRTAHAAPAEPAAEARAQLARFQRTRPRRATPRRAWPTAMRATRRAQTGVP